jgi:DNA-binding winged helix-turn-helix (wHTH) protein
MDGSFSGFLRSQKQGYSFADFRLEANGTLLRGAAQLDLQPQELALLRVLLARAGEVVTPLELKRVLRDDPALPTDALSKIVAALRTQLHPADCIESVHKDGYRISVDVHAEDERLEGGKLRLAILPFTSGYGIPEYLSYAVVEQAIERLGKGPSIVAKILPRNSVVTLAQRGLGALEIGKALRADLVLSGSLNSAPNHARLRAEMTNGNDGTSLWMEEILVESGQFVELIAKFVNRLVYRLQSNTVDISAEAAPEIEEVAPPRHGEAYELYLRARYEWKTFERHRMQDGMGHLMRAIELEPDLIEARIDLVHLCIMQAIFGNLSPLLAAAMVRRATQGIQEHQLREYAGVLAPALGWVNFYMDRKLPEAVRAFDRASHLPHDQWITPVRAMFALSRQHYGEASDLLHEAIRLDPYMPWLHAKLAWVMHLAGEAAASVDLVNKAMEKFPENDRIKLYGSMILSYNGEAAKVLEMTQAIAARMAQYDFAASAHAYVLACAGRTEEAHNILERLQWFSRERYVLNTLNVPAYAALGETQAAINELRIANNNRCPWFFQMLIDPRLKVLHGEPEFEFMCAILPAMEAEVASQAGQKEPQVEFYSEAEATPR